MSRRAQMLFSACFLLIIFGVPGIELIHSRGSEFADLLTRPPTQENLRAFERGIENSSVCARVLRPWIQYIWFAALSNPGEKALLGRDGWLFYKPDVRYLVEPCHNRSDVLSAIIGFRDQLARRGIHLMVLPMPGKPTIYGDRLTRRAAALDPRLSSHTVELIAALRKSRVETLDLDETFLPTRETAPYYLAQDTHWSGSAARLAAGVVAGRLRALGWIETGSAEYDEKPVSVRRRGDIFRMLALPYLDGRYPPEEVRCDQVIQRETGKRYQDDPQAPVLVLGDSFLRMYETDAPTSAGFIAHLARELKRPVASIVNDGGASTLVRQELSRQPALLHDKKLVIWEFVERDIRFGTEGWKPVPLPGD